jgi:hypothetical protein
MNGTGEIPVGLTLAKMALLATTILAMLLYPLLPVAQREGHAEIIEKIDGRLITIRTSLRLLLSGTAKFLQSGFGRLYGGPVRMIFTSALLTFVYILLAVLFNWNWVVGTRAFSIEKLALDRSVDPQLKYSPDAIKKAQEFYIVGIKEMAHAEPRFRDSISEEIRESFDLRYSRWFDGLKKQDHAQEIAFLTIFQGYSWDPGPRGVAIFTLFALNVVLDLLVVVSVRATLSKLAVAETIRSTIFFCVVIFGITLIVYIIFLLPTLYFFEGYDASYALLLLALPLSLVLVLLTAFNFLLIILACIKAVSGRNFSIWNDDVSVFSTLVFGVLSCWFLAYVLREIGSLGLPPVEYKVGGNLLPYALASCAVAPGLLTLCCLALAFIIRVAGSMVTAPIVGYLGFVADAPRIVGVTLLALPYAVVDLLCQAYENWQLILTFVGGIFR